VAAFTVEEARDQLKKMARNKSADDSGLVVEILQEASEQLLQTTVEVFNEIFQQDQKAPAAWRKSCIKVLFKKGDAKMPENYRPITLLRIMYKLFSRMVNGRIQEL
jgi:hypothetical protein